MNSCHEVKRSIRSTTYKFNAARRLCEAIRKKRPDLWKNNSWPLHHDNAPVTLHCLFVNFRPKTVTMPQPQYLPDMASCDFLLFPKIKRTLKGRRFTAIDDIKSASLKELKAIPKIEFEKCIEDWE